MAFAHSPDELHRPLGFTFGVRTGGAEADVGWIGIERPTARAAGAARELVGTTAPLPPDLAANERWLARSNPSHVLPFVSALANGSPSAIASARGVVDGQRVSILGLAAGRLAPPDRSALRAFLLTDALVEPALLDRAAQEIAARSFATIAGMTPPRTGDSLRAIASGFCGVSPLAADSIGWRTLLVGGTAVAQRLVRQLLERAFSPKSARVVQVTVSGAADETQATFVAERLAADAGVRSDLSSESRQTTSTLAAVATLGPEIARAMTPRVAILLRSNQGALQIDLGAGAAMATRWTAVPIAERK